MATEGRDVLLPATRSCASLLRRHQWISRNSLSDAQWMAFDAPRVRPIDTGHEPVSARPSPGDIVYALSLLQKIGFVTGHDFSRAEKS